MLRKRVPIGVAVPLLTLYAFCLYDFWGSKDLLIKFFRCDDLSTSFCDYQTLATGIAAILAAIIAGGYVNFQTQQNSLFYSSQLAVSNYQFQHSLNHKAFAAASSISSEILALVRHVKAAQYIEHFKEMSERIKKDESIELTAFPIDNNYFVVFESLVPHIGVIGAPFPEKICGWYIRAKGFVDTVRGINSSYYNGCRKSDMALDIAHELQNLLNDGDKLAAELNAYAYQKKEKALMCEKQIESKLSI